MCIESSHALSVVPYTFWCIQLRSWSELKIATPRRHSLTRAWTFRPRSLSGQDWVMRPTCQRVSSQRCCFALQTCLAALKPVQAAEAVFHPVAML